MYKQTDIRGAITSNRNNTKYLNIHKEKLTTLISVIKLIREKFKSNKLKEIIKTN